MPDWPGTLPQYAVLRNIRIGGPSNSFMRTQMEVGPAKSRRRSTAASRYVQVVYSQMTDAQVDTFEAWFDEDVAGGALTFTMPHPKDQGERTWRFVDTASPYNIEPYTRTLWRLTMTLELMP